MKAIVCFVAFMAVGLSIGAKPALSADRGSEGENAADCGYLRDTYSKAIATMMRDAEPWYRHAAQASAIEIRSIYHELGCDKVGLAKQWQSMWPANAPLPHVFKAPRPTK